MAERWSNQKCLEILLQYRGMGTILPKISKKENSMNELKFPRTFRAIGAPFTGDDLLVEFASITSGTVVKSSSGLWDVEYYSNGWAPCTDTEKWEPVKSLLLKRKTITTKDTL